jgi:putative PIN family toxin of toxin-antitoxin system
VNDDEPDDTRQRPPAPVVIDTSVYLSAEVFSSDPGSASREVVARAAARQFDVAVSPLLLAEVTRKLLLYFPEELAAAYIAQLLTFATTFTDGDTTGLVCTDPEDLFVLALARECGAWFIVAQDKSLSLVHPLGCKPGYFLARLRELRGEPEGQRFTPGA